MAEKTNKKYNDLGLGTKGSSDGYRALNKDGTFNIRKTNIPFLERINFFHALISMSWMRFLFFVLVGYFAVNILFATIYVSIGVENLTGIAETELSPGDQFMECFFFSAQTITTLGYGRVAPIGVLANTIAAIESMMGLLAFALVTGLLYGRFSRPSATIKYSENAVVSPYHDINGFMFRVINPQNNQLLEVEVTVSLSFKRENSDLRDFFQLELERPKVVFFPSIWTVVHPINESSPLFKLTEEDVLKRDAEFIIILKAFDESFSQTVYSRTSYKAFEIKWGEKFVTALQPDETGMVLDASLLNVTQKMPLN